MLWFWQDVGKHLAEDGLMANRTQYEDLKLENQELSDRVAYLHRRYEELMRHMKDKCGQHDAAARSDLHELCQTGVHARLSSHLRFRFPAFGVSHVR